MATSSHHRKIQFDDLKDILECKICLRTLDDPRVLQCQHSFCFICLKTLADKNKPAKRISCPVCREIWDTTNTGPQGLKPSFIVNTLMDILIKFQIYQPKSQKRKHIQSLEKTGSADQWTNDLIVISPSKLVAVRPNCIQFYENLALIRTIDGEYRGTKTCHNSLAFTHVGTEIISIYDFDGNHMRDIKTPCKRLCAIAFNTKGEIVVSDIETKSIFHLDFQNGRKKACTEGNATFGYPQHIAVTANDDIIVSDWKLDSILVVDREGKLQMQYGNEGCLSAPHGVCAKGNNIIVADWGNHRVSLISHDGNLLKHLVTEKDGIYRPWSVALSHEGQLLVGDRFGELFEVDFIE